MRFKTKFRLIKCRIETKVFQTKLRFFTFLAKHNIVCEHKFSGSSVFEKSPPKRFGDISSDRFIFCVSGLFEVVTTNNEHWFYSRFSGKRLFTIADNHESNGRIRLKAELLQFYAHFSPSMRMWVRKTSPVVVTITNSHMFNSIRSFEPDTKPAIRSSYRCDFSKCDYRMTMLYNIHDITEGEVISTVCKRLKAELTSKLTEINKNLTGVDCDGDIVSKTKHPLADYLVCAKCGRPVFSTEIPYNYECVADGIVQVKRISPEDYSNRLKYFTEFLESTGYNK